MAKKANSVEEIMFDQRIVARHVKRGLVSKDEHQKYLESLEDSAEHAEDCETVFSYRIESEDEEASAN
jgi:hypothetical protein